MSGKTPAPTSTVPSDEAVIALAAETAAVSVETIVSGRVRVVTHSHIDETTVDQDLTDTGIDIRRIPMRTVFEPGATLPTVRTEDGVTIVPVFEEEVVVLRRVVQTEEIHLSPVTSTRSVSVPVTLRRQTATIEHPHADEMPVPPHQETDQ